MRTPLQSYELVRKTLGKLVESGVITASGFREECPHVMKCMVAKNSNKGFFVFTVPHTSDDSDVAAALRHAVVTILKVVDDLKGGE